MAVDVVRTRLGVVLDHEDAGVLPLRAWQTASTIAPERQVVVGHHRPGRWIVRVDALGVVARQAHDHQVRAPVSRRLYSLYSRMKMSRPHLVALQQRPVVVVRGRSSGLRLATSVWAMYLNRLRPFLAIRPQTSNQSLGARGSIWASSSSQNSP